MVRPRLVFFALTVSAFVQLCPSAALSADFCYYESHYPAVIRRPAAIRPFSIDSIVHDGESLWLSTIGHYECIGDPPALGLARYEWEMDRLDTFVGRDDGPCGFVVHDLLLDAKYLWVATDL